MHVLVVVLAVEATMQVCATVRAHIPSADLGLKNQLFLAAVAAVPLFLCLARKVHLLPPAIRVVSPEYTGFVKAEF